MSDLNEVELQNLKHLIGMLETNRCKMTAYADSTNDKQVKQFFSDAAKDAGDAGKQLMKFLDTRKG